MVVQVGTTTPLYSTPYISVAEFKNAPTAIDVNDLVNGGIQALQDEELTNVVARASSWIDTHCGQVLAATTDTEQVRSRVSGRGELRLHPRYSPVLQLNALSFGYHPALLTGVVDLTSVWIEQSSIIAPISSFGSASFQGPLQFGAPITNREIFVQYTYVNGYPNTVLNGATLAGVSSLPLGDVTGIIGGLTALSVYDGVNSETVHVLSVSGNTVTLTAPTVNPHSSGISVSALPPAVKQAAIFVTVALLMARGSEALVMGSLSPSKTGTGQRDLGSMLGMAKDLLKTYRRIR